MTRDRRTYECRSRGLTGRGTESISDSLDPLSRASPATGLKTGVACPHRTRQGVSVDETAFSRGPTARATTLPYLVRLTFDEATASLQSPARACSEASFFAGDPDCHRGLWMVPNTCFARRRTVPQTL